MTKTKRLPAKIFVKVETDGENSYFVADSDLYGMVEMGEKVQIGTYQLVETTFAEAIVKTSNPIKK